MYKNLYKIIRYFISKNYDVLIHRKSTFKIIVMYKECSMNEAISRKPEWPCKLFKACTLHSNLR